MVRLIGMDWFFLEKTFTDNPKKENNWDFYYFLIKDINDDYIHMYAYIYI